MKKLSALAVAILILVAFAGCGKKTPEPARTKNTLVLSDESKTLLGARARFNDVISVVKEEVRILEDSHNENIRLAEPDNYFLNENYILSSFDPFNIADLSLTDYFDDSLDDPLLVLYTYRVLTFKGMSFTCKVQSLLAVQMVPTLVVMVLGYVAVKSDRRVHVNTSDGIYDASHR